MIPFVQFPCHRILLLVLAALVLPAAAGAKWTYLVDPVNGDDVNPAGKHWKTFGKLNSIKLAPGDTVVIPPGRQDQSLKPIGTGTAEKPVVIEFLPGTHTIGIHENIRITGNHFEGAGVNAKGAQNLVITGNRSPGGTVAVELDPSCSEITLEDN